LTPTFGNKITIGDDDAFIILLSTVDINIYNNTLLPVSNIEVEDNICNNIANYGILNVSANNTLPSTVDSICNKNYLR